ncbi:MAG: hypothetical protein ACLTYN_07105 [Dysosmobacter welbionis]
MDLTLNNAVMGVGCPASGSSPIWCRIPPAPAPCHRRAGSEHPDVIKEAARAALDANDTHYPPAAAIPTRWRPSPNSRLRPMASTRPVRSS